MMRPLAAADLYCGAGGSSEGLAIASAEFDVPYSLVAVNHDPHAIVAHATNHPNARHIRTEVDKLRPRALSCSGKLDILWASPACTEHSYAKGGASLDYKSRVSAWAIPREVERYRPRIVIVENVPSFQHWGPVECVFNDDGTPKMAKNGEQVVRPIKSRRGATFNAWFAAMESSGSGYTGRWKVLNCADHGAAQTRSRLFAVFTAPGVDYEWPAETHGPADSPDVLSGRLAPYTPARAIVELGRSTSRSIFSPLFGARGNEYLSPTTLLRIAAGVWKFCSPAYNEAFLVVLRRNADARSLDLPLPPILAKGHHIALAEPVLRPFTIGQHGGSVPRDFARDPLSTVTTAGFVRVAEPYLARVNRGLSKGETHASRVSSLDYPLGTVTTKNGTGLADPIVALADELRDDPRIVEIDGVAYFVDVLFRMLDTDEIAAAQGFRRGYVFTGGRGNQTMQIGNAVEVTMATALYRQAFLALGYSRKAAAA